MYFKEETRNNIEKIVGLPIGEIQNLSLDGEIAYVEQSTRKGIRFPTVRNHMHPSTGNPLIDRYRFCTMEDVDKKLDKLLFPHSIIWRRLKQLTKRKS
jgi:hypothetical protein